jgi:isochorismate synthase
MDRVFVDSADPCEIAHSWSVYCDYTQLHAVLAQAATRAARTGQPTLASLILPVPDCDALWVFRALQRLSPGECFYWEQPSRQMALVGSSTALSIQTHGSERFTQANQEWQHLLASAVIQRASDLIDSAHGPALFGGFSFDPLRTPTSLWQDFPAGLLILPRLLFSQRNQQTTLTLNCLVRAGDDLDKLADEINEQVAELTRVLPALPEMTLTVNQEYATRDIWSAQAWQELVHRTVRKIQQGQYAKVVLAREVEVKDGIRSFSVDATLQRLRQSYPGANVFAFQRGKRTFIGATPERLVHAQDGQLHTMALAGSAPRGINAEDDHRLGSELLHSPKNRQEHEIVISTIRQALDQLCSRIWVNDTPELLRLKNIQHLQTAIVGELLPGRSILEALHMLHPTPAVGGSPTESALTFIRKHENLDRGWYAGPLGWIDLQGNGEFAVALRSALLEEHRARLFAGCGIVADSDPATEYAESCLKLQVILRSLSGED